MIRTCEHCGQENRIPSKHLADRGKCGRCKASLSPQQKPISVDEAEFREIVAQARVPVLVDFWAAWCGPCRMAAPHVERTASEAAGEAIVLKVDTDKNPGLAREYNVSGIPNFALIKHGKLVMQQAGLVDSRRMLDWIRQARG